MSLLEGGFSAAIIFMTCLSLSYLHPRLAVWMSLRPPHSQIQVADVSAAGATVSEPFELSTEWNFKLFVDPDAQ
jgi:hypothetical protein